MRRVVLALLFSLGLAGMVSAQNVESLGPAVGAAVPPFSAVDQFGRTQTLESVAGPAGTMIVFYRSADW